MIYGKLVGGALHGAPRPIKTSEGDVFTNDPALLLQYGYKPIITAEYPSDGGYYTESWTETESEIKQIWTAVALILHSTVSASRKIFMEPSII